MPSVNALLTPVFRFAGRGGDLERLDGRDLELHAAVRAGEDLALDQVPLLDRSAALRAFAHRDSSFRIRSTSSTVSACFDWEYRSSPTVSWALAICTFIASGEGPPWVFRREREARTLRTPATSSPNLGSNARRDFASTFASDCRKNRATISCAPRNATPLETRYSARSPAKMRGSAAAFSNRVSSKSRAETAEVIASSVVTTWSTASKTGALSSWRSRLYASGRDFRVA